MAEEDRYANWYFDTLQTEFRTLKAEQLSRVAFRDSLFWYNFASLATIVTATSTIGVAEIFLMAPLSTLVFGWLYLMNDVKVSHLGEYFRRVLAKRVYQFLSTSNAIGERIGADLEQFKREGTVQASVATETSIYLWEFFHADDEWRGPRKQLQKRIDLIAFPGLGMMAAVGFGVCRISLFMSSTSTTSGGSITVLILSILAAVILFLANFILCRWVLRYADVTRHSAKRHAADPPN
jgi:small-conductance mechanosensitive channel